MELFKVRALSPGHRVWISLLLADSSGLAAQAEDLDALVFSALQRSRAVLARMSTEVEKGHLAIVCAAMASVAVGPRDSERLQVAVEKLCRYRLDYTYDLSARLVVMAMVPGYPDRVASARQDLAALLRNRRPGGCFGYHPYTDRVDMSNSQFATWGMHAASVVGVEIADREWLAVAEGILRCQDPSGGFKYTSRHAATVPITAGAVAALQLCAKHTKSGTKAQRRVIQAIARAWNYIERQKQRIGTWPVHAYSAAWYFAIGRAATLSEKAAIGGLDWYACAARNILRHESERGGWCRSAHDRKKEPDEGVQRDAAAATSLIVMFLGRGFLHQASGPITHGWRASGTEPEPGMGLDSVWRTARHEVREGAVAIPRLLRALRSPILERRMVAALAIPAITGESQEFAGSAAVGDLDRLAKATELWWLSRRGR